MSSSNGQADAPWAIRAEGLGKRYRRGRTIDWRRLWQPARQRADEWFHALRGVSFTVNRGEVLGVIGPNGAGKSTLLKILTRITEPSEGRALLRGRVSSLLEVGTGFNPELTGRENVYLNGVILGMRKEEIDRKFDAIAAFSGVEDFLDTPVKRYSSGMRVRLAFSVAAHLEPEILLIDEVLAVGDASFQKQCLGKMDDVAKAGRTVLFVSHNMAAVQQLCPKSLLLREGRLVAIGESTEVVRQYLGVTTREGGHYEWRWTREELEQLSPFVPLAVRVRDAHGHVSDRVSSKAPFTLELDYELTGDAFNFECGFTLALGNGARFCTMWEPRRERRDAGRYTARCEVPARLFKKGGFVLGIISRMPGIAKTFRDFELLAFYIDHGAALHETGRTILMPDFPWHTERHAEVS